MARGLAAKAAAEEFLEHATAESQHADQIAERIVQLGGEPDFDPNTSPPAATRSTASARRRRRRSRRTWWPSASRSTAIAR
jgi:hypothetical protein